jgi:hypothetical protein
MADAIDYGDVRRHLEYAPDHSPTARAIAWSQICKQRRAAYSCSICHFVPTSDTEHALWAELDDHFPEEHPETATRAVNGTRRTWS